MTIDLPGCLLAQKEMRATDGAQSPDVPFLPHLHRLDEAGVLYHPLTDRLLVINPTAKLIWELLAEGYDKGEIQSVFARHFAISDVQAARDVAQVFADLTLDSPDDHQRVEGTGAGASPQENPVAVADRQRARACGTFRFGRNRIQVLSSVPEVDEGFFSRFQHRAVDDGDDTERLEIWQGEAAYLLMYRDRLIATSKTINQTISRLVELLLGIEHPETPLLAYCHAAGVSRRGRSLLIPGSSGVGKSTLTAFLVANGFTYLGDDMIAIGEEAMTLAPLPTCLSIKSGSWPVLEPQYPLLPTLPTLSRYGRSVRYIKPAGNYEALETAAAPSAILFPAYVAGGERARLTGIRPLQAMIRLLGAHARLSSPASEAKLARWIRFVELTPAYELHYAELPDAMQMIDDLLHSSQR
jgi:hypothetical protein